MIIDVHTHVFPEAIAAKTLEILKNKMLAQSGVWLENVTDGTVGGLLRSMRDSSVNVSLVMPIATKISQTATINRFAEGLRDGGIISFGSVHPEDPDAESVLADLKARGFLGIKLHPEFQNFYIDSPESLRVLNAAHKLGLFTLIHAGGDLGYPAPYHCTPDRLKSILGDINPSLTIAAHLGGYEMWDEVMKFLPHSGVFVDTAAVGTTISSDVYRDIIRSLGAEYVLFGSDTPWESQRHALQMLDSTGIDDSELELIKYKNACRIFGIREI